MNFWMERVYRDDDLCHDIEAEVISFLEETNMKLVQLRNQFGGSQ
jgi:hypothetical protein